MDDSITGLAMVLAPALVGQLLPGVEISGVSIVIARVAGIALIALSFACLPGRRPLSLAYSVLVTPYLAYIGLAGEFTGRLLSPAVGRHGILIFLLAGAARASKITKPPVDSKNSNEIP